MYLLSIVFSLVVNTSAVSCLERIVSKMNYYWSSGLLYLINPLFYIQCLVCLRAVLIAHCRGSILVFF